MLANLRQRLVRPTDAASLAAFRAVFAAMIAIGTLRLLAKGYVEEAFGVPKVFFAPWPLEGVLRPLSADGMTAVYVVIAVASITLSLGLATRISAATVCVLFTYAHFVDLTNYLNHYWLVTLLTGLMVVVPVSSTLSLDARLGLTTRREELPRWMLGLFQFQIAVVYFFAGLAKLRPDWLFAAQPLRTWLLANGDTPLVGVLFGKIWVAFAMSWAGAFFDLTIVAWLSWRRSRPFAYAAVVVFHMSTSWLFHIGMFPFFMMAASLLFLEAHWPRRFVARMSTVTVAPARVPWVALAVYALVQIALPLRAHLYGGNVLWHEQGYRFGWNVMLMEKLGSIDLTTVDRSTGARRHVALREHLTRAQEKAMATQPDMILAFARHLARRERAAGREVEVHVDVWVVLNGRPARQLVDPAVDLAREHDGLAEKRWILPAPP